jgi:small subunit ribosomal protein S20
MANTYSALKRVRETERRTQYNRQNKTRLRHQIRAMRRALLAKDA